MFFDTWWDIGRVIVSGILSYLILIAFVRVSGKRTLAKMNAFDLVVTVALGSLLATIVLSKDVALIEGAVALAMLILLQYSVSWFSVRSSTVNQLVKSEPRLLFHHGQFLHRAMKMERVNESEVLQAVRSQGISALDQVEAVVLETDGSFSVLRQSAGGTSALADVQGPYE